jgi:hypothetical protein
MSSRDKETCVAFGVQISAASGRGVEEERSAEMEGKCGMEREETVMGPWEAGSVSEWRVQVGERWMERAWRGPMRPEPMRAMVSFGEVIGVVGETGDEKGDLKMKGPKGE